MDVKEILDKGFHRSLADLDVFHIGKDGVRARLAIGDSLRNFFGNLHGGAIATLVDDVGTFAVMAADHYHRAGATTDLHVSYVSTGAAGDSVLIEATIVSCGLTIAFVEVTLTSESGGEVIARGQMTKLLGAGSTPKRVPKIRDS
jgi:acyl-coenzyme A thioesterase 13